MKLVINMNDNQVQNDVIRFVQGDIPVAARPYQKLAASMGINEDKILDVVKELKTAGKIRRYGAVLRHQKAGFVVNAMVAWQVPPGQEDAVGHQMASCRQISHLYLRQVPADFPYNMFSMVHARTREELELTVNQLAEQTGVTEYQVLHSVLELKKISMQYVLSAE